ncbi:TonB-dependent receptor plug domain-containing protein [Shewanella youngdeokensis]|uniref:TonB-dependent receptor n=1 Tax=Shewanella youngdeokensis TaxID=2999068 RepID=A0ABZ0JVB4_9GAMM|nr:TonB-dependent receptor [Shewanella sp. DAU334]
MLKKSAVAIAVLLSLSSQTVFAENSNNASDAEQADIEKIEVKGVRQRLQKSGMLSDSIMKTEVISSEFIENKNAVNLTEAIDNTPGVRVSNECSMCGVKRIMLNGLRGEQTTILVDGLPVHSMIAGYYAVDAIPTTGLDRIEVARGAGASLIAPEAIGGTINIVTKAATENGATVDVSVGEDGNQKVGLMGTGISDDARTRVTLIAQYDNRDQVDEDNNKVNEAPAQENQIFTVRLSHDLTDRDNVILRYSHVDSEIFGGPMLGETFADGTINSIGDVLSSFDDTESSQLFEDGDVRNDYTGKAWETTEWIHTERDEVSLSWLREINDDLNMTLATSYSGHIQDSFYEGFRYYAEDDMLYFDARFNYYFNNNHLITFGSDHRSEEMRSTSSGESNANYVSDSFDYNVLGFYLQDTWQASENLEVNMALRFDSIEADFIDPKKSGVEIDKSILAPRVDIRYGHNDNWTSRLSAGRGYRAPLSFFETDHGVLDASLGFEIDIEELERSTSATYALSFEGDKLTSTMSLAWTEVEHLATLSETDAGVPLLSQLDEKATVTTADIALGYDVTDTLTLNVTAEGFFYDDAFKSSYSLAPVEERLTMNADWDYKGWDVFVNLVWVGARDLSDYGYEGYNQVDANGNVITSSIKSTDAPSYWTMDMKVTKSITDNIDFYAGVNNLFDYTQVTEGESPLFFDADGGYDVAYIWGPLQGRQLYAGVKASF